MDTIPFPTVLNILVSLLVLSLGTAVIVLIWLYVDDKIQTKHATRHNIPVLGRMWYVFEFWGTFFRRYFFAQGREEISFSHFLASLDPRESIIGLRIARTMWRRRSLSSCIPVVMPMCCGCAVRTPGSYIRLGLRSQLLTANDAGMGMVEIIRRCLRGSVR